MRCSGGVLRHMAPAEAGGGLERLSSSVSDTVKRALTAAGDCEAEAAALQVARGAP